MRRVVTPIVAGLLLVAIAAPASAATSSEVLELARDAAFDDDALERLRAIDEIDGRAVDLERLLEGADRTEVAQRVAALLPQPPAEPRPAPDPDAERAEAERILEQDRYQPEEIPRPFRGPLEWIADRLEPVGNAFDALFRWVVDLFRSLANRTPGGAATLWTLAGLVIVGLVAMQTKRIIERRGHSRTEESMRAEAGRGVDDPRELERRAAAARAAGDHDLAVRLLFRAGVLRLARDRKIPARTSLTTGEIARLLHSPEFDRIGRSFDEIAYGRRPATGTDSDAARTGWSRVLQESAK